MKKLLTNISLIVLLSLALASCKDDKEACTEEFKSITVIIQNFDGTPASFEELVLINQNSNDSTYITNNGGDEFTLVDDNTQLGASEEFLLRGIQGGILVLSEPYIFGRDDCHVMKISGKSKITLD